MVWRWLRNWWAKGKSSAAEVVLYTRKGCHLCDDAAAQLEQARRRYGFALRSVDVDGDERLVRDYGECVPVVLVNGRVRFRGRINPVLLRRLLESESASPQRKQG